MIVTIFYILKSIKSVFILVQCNKSLSKNYVALPVTVVRVNFYTNSHSTTKCLKHSSNFEFVEVQILLNSN